MSYDETPAPGLVMVYMPDRGVGDLMWHLPTLRAIAASTPEGRVLLATRPSSRARDLLAAEPCVVAVDYLDYRAGTFRNLVEIADFYKLCRRRRPRAVWILEKIDRPAIGAALAGVPERRGFGLGHGQERWLTHRPFLPRSMRPAHRIEKLAALEAGHGLTVTSREPALVPIPAAVEAMEARFAGLPRPWIVYGVGSSEPSRCWPMERFGELTRELADLGGTRFWLGGFGDSAAVDAQLAAGADGVNVCDLKMDAAAALASRADLFIGNNSGPLNIAASVGVTSIGLFAGTAPLDYSRFLRAIVGPEEGMAFLGVESVAPIARLSL
jgi:heptosyltransferase-2